MTTKTLDTLVEDIYSLFNPDEGHEVSEDNLDKFAEDLKDVLRTRLRQRETPTSPLRFSALGQPDRKVWYKATMADKATPMSPKTYFKFLYGDVIECLILFLCKEAGHSVESEQKEVEVNGVKGHIDAIIDGVVVDVKSASPFGYKKFATNSVVEDDPFGYTQQLAGYASVLTPDKPAAWLAFDKVSGDICVASLSPSIINDYLPGPRIDHLKKVIETKQPPEKCYSDEEDGKSGNRKLGTACSYCEFNKECWPNTRTFFYSGRPRVLTVVKKTPNVPELGVAF